MVFEHRIQKSRKLDVAIAIASSIVAALLSQRGKLSVSVGNQSRDSKLPGTAGRARMQANNIPSGSTHAE
jgi:uncharacterized protein (DUF58 family)